MAIMDDYVSVNERVEQFLAKYPDGRIQTEIAKHTDDIVIMRATVYRDAEDPRPSVAHSQLGIPGKTGFTRDSEVENAETSAVGRALAFMGFETKKAIASREEVASRAHSEPPAAKSKQMPEWYAGFRAAIQEHDLKVKDCEPVIQKPLTPETYIHEISAWLASDPEHSIDKLVSRAADQKLAGV